MDIHSQLVKDLKRGSYDAFDKLYDIYADLLYGFALNLPKPPAEAQDILQETFLKIWLNRKGVSEELSFRSYLYSIARNLMIDSFRRRMNSTAFADYVKSESFRSDLPNDVESHVTFDEFLRNLEAAKLELTQRQREVFELSREQGMPISMIADRLGISEQTVKNQLTNALKTLREKLRRYSFFLFFL